MDYVVSCCHKSCSNNDLLRKNTILVSRLEFIAHYLELRKNFVVPNYKIVEKSDTPLQY